MIKVFINVIENSESKLIKYNSQTLSEWEENSHETCEK